MLGISTCSRPVNKIVEPGTHKDHAGRPERHRRGAGNKLSGMPSASFLIPCILLHGFRGSSIKAWRLTSA